MTPLRPRVYPGSPAYFLLTVASARMGQDVGQVLAMWIKITWPYFMAWILQVEAPTRAEADKLLEYFQGNHPTEDQQTLFVDDFLALCEEFKRKKAAAERKRNAQRQESVLPPVSYLPVEPVPEISSSAAPKVSALDVF